MPKAAKEATYTYAEQTVTCPYCAALAGQQCRTNLGRWRRNPHKERVLLVENPLQKVWQACVTTALSKNLLEPHEAYKLNSLSPFQTQVDTHR